MLTDGTCSFSAWDDAASVVTVLLANPVRTGAVLRRGATHRGLRARLSMAGKDELRERFRKFEVSLPVRCSVMVKPPDVGFSFVRG